MRQPVANVGIAVVDGIKIQMFRNDHARAVPDPATHTVALTWANGATMTSRFGHLVGAATRAGRKSASDRETADVVRSPWTRLTTLFTGHSRCPHRTGAPATLR